MITSYKFYNESIFGIDFSKIKEESYKFSKTKDCLMVMSELDPSLITELEKNHTRNIKKIQKYR